MNLIGIWHLIVGHHWFLSLYTNYQLQHCVCGATKPL